MSCRGLALLTLAGCLSVAPAAPPAEAPVDFNRDVKPILAKNCFACHGPDDTHRAAGLRLDQHDSAVKERKKGAAVVPGKPDASRLLARVTAADEAERMPPAETGNALDAAQVATLRRWIAQGAPYAEHWSFVPPRRPAAPVVRDRAWCRTGIDPFILARLEAVGLTPMPEADKYTLLRRVSFDLRGLPPTPEEVTAFAQDDRPDAYERVVERFLAAPAFGERWARMWLDLARYADSAGYGSDPLRPFMWRYRDWVIDAFNRNQPFDRFTMEQIAGDLLPGATLEQKVATAFHRNTMTNTEGGTDDEEFRVAAVKDRVNTTAQVWMGLTMGCAQCHTHKYDPITQKEYYQLFAVFNQTADNDQPSEAPTLPAPTPALLAANRQIDAQLADLRRQLDAPSPELAEAQEKWEASLRAADTWHALSPDRAVSDGGATLKPQEDGSVLAEGANPANDVYTVRVRSDLKGITAFRLETLPDPALPQGGAGRAPDGNFVLSRLSVSARPAGAEDRPIVGRTVRVELPGPGRILSLAEVEVFAQEANVAPQGQASQSSTDYEGAADRAIDGNTDGDYFRGNSTTHTRSEANPWWQVKLAGPTAIERVTLWNRTDGGIGTRLAPYRVLILDDAGKVVWREDVAEAPNPSRDLYPSHRQTVPLVRASADHVAPNFDVAKVLLPKADARTGWAVGPQDKSAHTAVFVTEAPVDLGGPAEFTFRLEHRFHMGGFNLGRFRLSAATDPRVLERIKVPADVLAALDTPADDRTPEQRDRLAAHFRTVTPLLQPLRDRVTQLEKSRPVAPNLPVMVELPASQRRKTHLMLKGNFLSPGEAVGPGLPAAFASGTTSEPPDRLAVARWLVDEHNPLTARVAVNRFWGQLFGTGVVETEEDFGTQGELPSHPELLDWLATEYVRLGWDTKALLRLLVTSAAYRQSAQVTPERLAKDPRNRLLSRGPRFRLEAEMVRDQALALSGLLARKVGGPSVYPPQPPGLWQAAFNSERKWATSTGPDRYRRGLYVFWRRTVPYPSMAAFDAPSRETCSVRRTRTNTPLQAFVTLNDPVYVEAAQALARRILQEGGTTAEERAAFGLRLCLARPPADAQVRAVMELYRAELERYQKDATAAAALATEPLGPLPPGIEAAEAAAWTVVANVLLNLDGVLARG